MLFDLFLKLKQVSLY